MQRRLPFACRDHLNVTLAAAPATPTTLFEPGLEQLRQLAPQKPIIIAETASTEIGGSKPGWIRSLFRYLAAQPDITAVIWFDHNKETDWRINSSPSSARAVARAPQARRSTEPPRRVRRLSQTVSSAGCWAVVRA